MGLGEGSWGKDILEKSLVGQERKKLFRKTKKFQYSILNFFPVQAITETAMEALPLLVIYLFNSGELDLVLKIC